VKQALTVLRDRRSTIAEIIAWKAEAKRQLIMTITVAQWQRHGLPRMLWIMDGISAGP
jgi:hypothetical protein